MHILLLEDDPQIAEGLCAGLALANFTVDHVETASAANHALGVGHFDAVILDLGLPDQDGIDWLQQLRASGNDMPVLILSARDSVNQRVDGLQAGADDYLLKPFDLRELTARLQTLLRRTSGRATHLIEHEGLVVDPNLLSVQLHGKDINLARREMMLLLAFLNNPKRIISVEQLQDALYGLGEGVESNAINVHIYNLRRKLGSTVIETVRGLGFRLGTPDESA